MSEEIHPLVLGLIENFDLNPVISQRPALRVALNISAVTQWRREKDLGIDPDGHMGPTTFHATVPYLTKMLGLDGR